MKATQAEIDKALYGRRKSKYGVGPPEERMADGIVFDSKHERDAYLHLKGMERAGVITELRLQPRFPLCAGNPATGKIEPVCAYVADFTCRDKDGRVHVYDAKGALTAMYKLKKKWFELQYAPMRITEI